MAARKNKSIDALAAAAKREAANGGGKTTTTRKKRGKKKAGKRRTKRANADIGKLADAVSTVNKARRLLADAGCSLSNAPRLASKKTTRRRRKKA